MPGKVTGQAITGIPGGGRTDTYSPLNQLASATGSRTDGFTYDPAGNSTTLAGSTQAFDSVNQLCWTAPTTSSSGADCTHPPTGATTSSFDPTGGRIKATNGTRTTTYGYDQDNHLTAVHGNGLEATYAYDLDGLRSTKTVNGTRSTFTWDSAGLLLSDGTTAYVYGPGGVPLEEVAGTTTRWYFHDQLGSTRVLTDVGGEVVGSNSLRPVRRRSGSTVRNWAVVEGHLPRGRRRRSRCRRHPVRGDGGVRRGRRRGGWRGTRPGRRGAVAAGGATSVSIGAVVTSGAVGVSAASAGTMGAYWLSNAANGEEVCPDTNSTWHDTAAQRSR